MRKLSDTPKRKFDKSLVDPYNSARMVYVVDGSVAFQDITTGARCWLDRRLLEKAVSNETNPFDIEKWKHYLSLLDGAA